MNYDWDNIIKKNVIGSDCQVVTAVNAYYLLTGKIIKPHYKRYEKLVDMAMARHGAAIRIEDVWKKLGIKPGSGRLNLPSPYDYKSADFQFPMELNIWHLQYGYHSALAVDYSQKCHAFRVTNLQYHTSVEGWIFYEDLLPLLEFNHNDKPTWVCRGFSLSPVSSTD